MAKDKTDKAFLERLKRDAPHVLDAEVDFDAALTKVLRASPDRLGIRGRRKRKRRITTVSKRPMSRKHHTK